MVHRRELNGEPIVLGNQGALWGNAMTWWDHETGSVWSQPLGEAIVGPLEGERLELMASRLTEWKTWRADHPETLALAAPGGRSGFAVEQTAIVADFGSEVGVFPVSALIDAGPANEQIAGVPIAVVVDPNDPNRWSVFHRALDGQVLTLVQDGDRIVDTGTGTVWDPANGRGLAGPMAGEILDSLPGFTSFERDARTFWPDAKYWEP